MLIPDLLFPSGEDPAAVGLVLMAIHGCCWWTYLYMVKEGIRHPKAPMTIRYCAPAPAAMGCGMDALPTICPRWWNYSTPQTLLMTRFLHSLQEFRVRVVTENHRPM